MIDKKNQIRRAVRAAIAARKKGNHPLNEPICPYDLATETYKIDIRFEPTSSLEGLYSRNPLAIIIGSQRPAGRQAYTCAHELGHHIFGHGIRVDEINSNSNNSLTDPEEFLAQVFAGYLLMPKLAVSMALRRFNVNPTNATSQKFFSMACYLGVGYTTFINHLNYALKLIPRKRAEELKKTNLKNIRNAFGSPEPSKHLVVAEIFSEYRSYEIEIGDLLFTPTGSIHEGLCLIPRKRIEMGCFWEAVRQGTSRIEVKGSNASTFIRVRPKEFRGRAIFRHEPDPDDE